MLSQDFFIPSARFQSIDIFEKVANDVENERN